MENAQILTWFAGGGGIIKEDIWVDVNSLVTAALGVGGGTVIVAKNESKSKLNILSLFSTFDKAVSD